MYHTKRNPYETRIVITGIGTINPIANTIDEYWENLIKGKNGIRKAQNSNLEGFDVQIGGEVDIPDMTGIMHKKLLSRLDRYVIFSQYAAVHALRDSGLEQEEIDKAPHRYAAIIGTGDAGLDLNHKMSKNIYEKGLESVSAFYIVGVIPNTPPGLFAKEFNFQGPNYSVSSACATSNHAIGTAIMLIKMGMADVVMAGGTESVVCESSFAAFNKIFALSRRNDSPETASRPCPWERWRSCPVPVPYPALPARPAPGCSQPARVRRAPCPSAVRAGRGGVLAWSNPWELSPFLLSVWWRRRGRAFNRTASAS